MIDDDDDLGDTLCNIHTKVIQAKGSNELEPILDDVKRLYYLVRVSPDPRHL